MNLFIRICILCKFFLQYLFFSCEQNLNIVPLLYCFYSAFYHLHRRIIAAHCIKRYSCHVRHLHSS